MTCLNKWSDREAQEVINNFKSKGINEDLALRTYSARLLGSDPELVLHGGGNTSVKSICNDLTGNPVEVLHVKGSGWDLATIEPEGHPAVRLKPLLELKKLKTLNDEDMVAAQRQNLLNPNAPNPSVETLLHAFMPYKFIDHTHSLAILSLANQPNAEEIFKEIFGINLVIVPYVMPGFELAISAQKRFELAHQEALSAGEELDGMVLINHGLFSFGDTAKESYLRMIKIVNEAENFLKRKINLNLNQCLNLQKESFALLPYLRGMIGRYSNNLNICDKWIFDIRFNESVNDLFKKNNLTELINLGVATPDHVIRTKAKPLLLKNYFDLEEKIDEASQSFKRWFEECEISLEKYVNNYVDYFNKYNKLSNGTKIQLDPLPRLILLPGLGLIGIGKDKKSAKISADIGLAWIETLLSAISIGTFKPVGEKDTFDLEYWSLEQAKINKVNNKSLKGNIVLVTGAGGVIGSQIAKDFYKEGAEVISLDLNENSAKKTAKSLSDDSVYIGCDITNKDELQKSLDKVISIYGGIDILISNAGAAWEGGISNIDETTFRKSMELNFFAHFFASKYCLKTFHAQDFNGNSKEYLMGGQILFNISKQALNPGPNFGSYGIAKSALVSLMRQISLEEGENQIRCNGVNADRIKTGLLDDEMIKKRSKSRGVSKEEYMCGNLLKSEVLPEDVSKAFLSLTSMRKTTGALITVDGGNVAAMVR